MNCIVVDEGDDAAGGYLLVANAVGLMADGCQVRWSRKFRYPEEWPIAV
jgi:hypothetical protein